VRIQFHKGDQFPPRTSAGRQVSMGWLDEPSYTHLPGARRHSLDEVGRGFWYGIFCDKQHTSLLRSRSRPWSLHRQSSTSRPRGRRRRWTV
jgi:hypothetical protein